MEDLGLFTLPCRLGDSKPFDTLADLGSCVNIIPLYLFKKLNMDIRRDRPYSLELAEEPKYYHRPYVWIVLMTVEVHIGKLNLLNNFYVIDMKKDPETPLLVRRRDITRSVFRVKGVDLGEEEAPYWTTLGKRESYKSRPHSDGIGTRTPYYARKDFLDCHLPRE
ncbi:MAK10-like protein [Tanacetum coccineum]